MRLPEFIVKRVIEGFTQSAFLTACEATEQVSVDETLAEDVAWVEQLGQRVDAIIEDDKYEVTAEDARLFSADFMVPVLARVSAGTELDEEMTTFVSEATSVLQAIAREVAIHAAWQAFLAGGDPDIKDPSSDVEDLRYEFEREGLSLSCSFCGKANTEVAKLIAGPAVQICDECVELCNDILAEENEPPAPGPRD